jgi:hypothetical protein
MQASPSTDPARPLCVPADTTLEAARLQIEALRRMTPEQRLTQGCRMNDEARALLRAGVRNRHPDYNAEQLRLATIRLLLGEEWFQVCFPGCNVEP